MEELVAEDAFIDSAEQVMKLVNQKEGVNVKYSETLKVLKQMGMKYRKVKHVPLRANSERNMVLR